MICPPDIKTYYGVTVIKIGSGMDKKTSGREYGTQNTLIFIWDLLHDKGGIINQKGEIGLLWW